MRGGRKGQERRCAEAVQVDLAVQVRKEIDRYPRADAFFITEQENFLELRETAAVDREDDLVDDAAAQKIRKRRERLDQVRPAQHDLGVSLRRVIGQKTKELDTVVGRALERLAQAPRGISEAHHHD